MLTGVASAQEQHRTFTVPFHSVNGMILLDATVNGKPAVLLLDTGADNSIVDVRSAGFDSLRLDALRSTGKAGAAGDCVVREVKLSLEHRSWLNRRVCVMDLSDVSIDGILGKDVPRTFSAVRIDQKITWSQDGFGNNRSEPTGSTKPDDDNDGMQKKSENVAHAEDGIRLRKLKNSGNLRNSPPTRSGQPGNLKTEKEKTGMCD